MPGRCSRMRVLYPRTKANCAAQDIAQAVQDADFVQENVPEREELKISVHEEISRMPARMWSSHQAHPGFCPAAGAIAHRAQ